MFLRLHSGHVMAIMSMRLCLSVCLMHQQYMNRIFYPYLNHFSMVLIDDILSVFQVR